MICYSLGIIGAYQILIPFYDAIISFPTMWMNMDHDMLSAIKVFKNQIKSIAGNVDQTFATIIHKLELIPNDITTLIKNDSQPIFDDIILKINSFFKCNATLQDSG